MSKKMKVIIHHAVGMLVEILLICGYVIGMTLTIGLIVVMLL